MAARTFTLAEVEPAFVASWGILREWLVLLTPEELGRASAVGGWTVADLTAHVELAMGSRIKAEQTDGDDAAARSQEERTRQSALIVSRLIEIVVHGDDLARSLPERPAPAFDRDSLRIVVRALLDMLSTRAPGRSVEVRVPPFAAVQCVEGPRHTRGTPPNTIQTDPLTWIRVATGRMTWDDGLSSGKVLASGERADLSTLLPLL